MPHESDNEILRFVDQAVAGKLTRRDVLRRAVAFGFGVPAIAALLAACGDDDEEEEATATSAPAGGGTEEEAATEEEAPTEEEMATEEEEATEEEAPTEEEMATEEEAPTEEEGGGEITLENPPEVANADAASQYSGAKIAYYGDTVGIGAELDNALASKFNEATGIEVEVIPKPQSATENFSTYARLFEGKSADIDVMMLDVIWPGSFAPHLVDLNEYFTDDEKSQWFDTIVQNNTVDDKFIAAPWFGDFGMLYYRTDLIEKYGFDGPPQTWDELEEMANTIMEGEQADNANFFGLVFQGNAYEGLTCDGLEWQASSGGGTIVENGEVTLNNDEAIAAFEKAAGWIGGIAPRDVTTYQEEDAREVFQGGNSAFMRNWPYAYALALDGSPVADVFDVAPLPAQEGSDHVGTLGGWQLGVSTYSNNVEAAVEFVRYMTSADVVKYRSVVGSYVPLIPSVAEDADVLEAMPFLETMTDVVRVTRPSAEARDLYNEVSTAYFQGLNAILNGSDASSEVENMADDIQDLLDELG